MLGTCSRGLIDMQREVGLPLPKTGESRGGFTEEVAFNQPQRLTWDKQVEGMGGGWLQWKMQCGEAMKCGRQAGRGHGALGCGAKGLHFDSKG